MKKKYIYFILCCFAVASLLAGCANKETILNDVGENITIDTDDQKEPESTQDNLSETDGHKHSYVEEITKESTCDERGVITYTCSCGDSYTEETSFMDHCTDRSEITKEATCTEEGIITYYCIFCGKEVYTESIAKLPHNENCNHETSEVVTDPKDYTFTQCFKIMFATDRTGLYASPDKNSEPYRYLEMGTVVPVVSKCDQADFYRTPWGTTVAGWTLTEERPAEYATGEEGVWENFKEESDSKYTYWSGIYRVNGYELHCEHMNKPYVERHMECARQGLYKLMYRELDTEYWSGNYEIMIEKGGFFYASEYVDWLIMYAESQGLTVAVPGAQETLLVYRAPKDENSEKLLLISVTLGK